MPILLGQHFSRQVAGDQAVQAPSPPALTRQGPKVQVEISLPQTISQQLTQQGLEIPGPVTGHALIDTGASGTCIDIEVAQTMDLPVIDQVRMSTPSDAAIEVNVYPVHLSFLGSPVQIDCRRAIGATLCSQGLIALIGRDVLQHCIFVYNGVAGQFTLAV